MLISRWLANDPDVFIMDEPTCGVDLSAGRQVGLAAGQLYGTVLNDAKGQAQAMVALALALYTGEDPAQAVALEDGHYIWLPYRQVTREDLTQLPAQ